MSYNAGRIISEDLGFYLTLKRFWQNLGMRYQEVQSLPQNMIETLNDIMILEEKFNEKEMKKRYSENNLKR